MRITGVDASYYSKLITGVVVDLILPEIRTTVGTLIASGNPKLIKTGFVDKMKEPVRVMESEQLTKAVGALNYLYKKALTEKRVRDDFEEVTVGDVFQSALRRTLRLLWNNLYLTENINDERRAKIMHLISLGVVEGVDRAMANLFLSNYRVERMEPVTINGETTSIPRYKLVELIDEYKKSRDDPVELLEPETKMAGMVKPVDPIIPVRRRRRRP